MALITKNLNLNGTTNFTLFGQNYTWGNFGNLPVFPGGPPDTYRLNLTLSGTAWYLNNMSFDAGSSFAVNITDTNDGQRRNITFLQFGENVSTANVTLYNTRVKFIEGGTLDTTLTLGDQRVRHIELGDGNDTVTQGNGAINSVFLNGGTNVFNGSAGQLHYLNFGPGINTFTSGAGYVGTIRADGDTTLSLSNGAEMVWLGTGANKVTVSGGQVVTLMASGDETISLLGDARILQLKMDEGVNTLTTENGNIESIYAFHAKNTLNLGLGGAQQIVLSGSAEAQVIQSQGFLGSLQIYAVNQVGVAGTLVTTGSDGAGYIQTSYGNDVVTGGTGKIATILTYEGADTVTVGAGGAESIDTGTENDTVNAVKAYVDFIDTQEGTDTVILGKAGARMIEMGEGDDTVSLEAMVPDAGILINGEAGSDTLNLSRFVQGATVALDKGGSFQDFGLAGTAGFVLLHDIENLIGTTKNDIFTGSDQANRLSGALGADNLSGLDGDDILIGGKGNDTLTGGAGLDDFIFAAGDGSDRITDFTLGEDHLSIAGTRRLADITFTKAGLNVDVSVGTLHILVEDMTVAAMRDAANFLF